MKNTLMILVFAKIKFRDINFRVDQFFSGFPFFAKQRKLFSVTFVTFIYLRKIFTKYFY